MASPYAVTNYRERVLGCWLGKSVGGTLGAPCEGKDGPLSYTFYDPVPTEMIPNDDLDLQVLWACVLDKMEKPRVDRNIIAKAWVDHVTFPWDEYGVCIRNIKRGLMPPLSGSVDNFFTRGMGAAIRSELWACIAPGDPALAAEYAYEDACTDHAGEGIWAEVFLAALESAAFAGGSIRSAIDSAACVLPSDSELGRAIRDTINWWDASGELLAIRSKILTKYGSDNFTDVVQNLAFITLALLSGNGDFSKTICDAVNCGKDTDCTGATVGAILGILDPKCIGSKWLAPIGRNVVLNKQITGITHPKTLDEFTDMVISLGKRMQKGASNCALTTVPAGIAHLPESWFSGSKPDFKALESLLKPINLPGACASLPGEAFKDAAAAIRYRLEEPEGAGRRVMFNFNGPCKVFIDGNLAFASEVASPLVPSFHRCPKNQFADLTLSKGVHEVVAFIKSPAEGQMATWIFGVGEGHPSFQWLEVVYR